MKFVISNQKFSEAILFLYRNFYHFYKIVRKIFIRLLTAKMSTINLCKMARRAAVWDCSARRGKERSLPLLWDSVQMLTRGLRSH